MGSHTINSMKTNRKQKGLRFITALLSALLLGWYSLPSVYRVLHLPDCVTFRNYTHEQKICDAGLQVFNRIDPEQKLWYCEMFVPYAGFMKEKNSSFRFGLGRYDYEDDPEKPAISCWPLMKATLHSPEDWRELPIQKI